MWRQSSFPSVVCHRWSSSVALLGRPSSMVSIRRPLPSLVRRHSSSSVASRWTLLSTIRRLGRGGAAVPVASLAFLVLVPATAVGYHSYFSEEQPATIPKTSNGVPLALLDLSKIRDFDEWLFYLGHIENRDKVRQKQLQRIHEYALACYLYRKAMEEEQDNKNTDATLQAIQEAIRVLEESPLSDMDTLVTWQGLSVDWLVNEFFEHPYLQEVRKFGCQAWHFRKWGVMEMIRRCEAQDLGAISGPFVNHLEVVQAELGSIQTDNRKLETNKKHWVSQFLKMVHSTLFCPTRGTPTTFISYTGAYTMELVVDSLRLLPSNEIIWMDIFCADQFAWTGKSRSPKMKEFRETFVNDLENQIGKISHTALVLEKWDDVMLTLAKMWVLWEIFNTAEANAKLTILLTPEQVSDFVEKCLESNEKFDVIQTSLANIDASQAEASDDGDRQAIFPRMQKRRSMKVYQQ